MKRLIVLVFVLGMLTVTASAQTVRLEDSSDWWSINRTDPGRPSVKPSADELQPRNFEIAGVTLGRGNSDAITGSLGRVPTVERGDASTGRFQYCYSSAQSGSVHLVFEFGEDESVVYLFSEGKSWNGEKYCISSNKVSRATSTNSGLKLGLSRAEVESILGQPDSVTPDSFVYCRDFKKKPTAEQFEVFKRDYPQKLSDQEAHKDFDYYPVEQYVLAKFTNSKLVYLAIAISGEGD
jgi:hypothetical protein